MKALSTSVLSLYEASEIVPGQSMTPRDMLRGGEPLLVHEHSATQSLKQWDRIAARVVTMNGKPILAGGVLPFTLEGTPPLDRNSVVLRKRVSVCVVLGGSGYIKK